VAFGSFAAAWLLYAIGIVLGATYPEVHRFGRRYAIRVDDETLIVWRNLSRWIVIDFFMLFRLVLLLSGMICVTLGIVWFVRDMAQRREEERKGFEVVTKG